jgi:hypothetical protein
LQTVQKPELATRTPGKATPGHKKNVMSMIIARLNMTWITCLQPELRSMVKTSLQVNMT